MGIKSNADLSALQARLRALEEERNILRTLYRYGHTMDYGPGEEWVDCFTEDGVFAAPRREGGGHRQEGRAALTAFMANHSRAPAKYHKHLLIEPRISINGNEARVESYFARLDETRGEPYLQSFGRYKDRLVKCPDGVWRFKERIAEVEAIVPGVGLPPSRVSCRASSADVLDFFQGLNVVTFRFIALLIIAKALTKQIPFETNFIEHFGR